MLYTAICPQPPVAQQKEICRVTSFPYQDKCTETNYAGLGSIADTHSASELPFCNRIKCFRIVYKDKVKHQVKSSRYDPHPGHTLIRYTMQEYVFPPHPSRQVKVVQEYLKFLSKFDLDGLSGLTTDNFTQSTSPTNLGVPTRTKSQDLAFLKGLEATVNTLSVSKSGT
jgi:hypothetical protein